MQKNSHRPLCWTITRKQPLIIPAAHWLMSAWLASTIILAVPSSTLGQTPPGSTPTGANPPSAGLSGNVDLTSTQASMVTKASDPVQINVGGTISANGVIQGGQTTTINPGQMLTPAQYIAVQQVLHTGNQTLLLSGEGSAIGGFANLRPSYASSIGSLTIPQNVSLNSIGFNSSTPLTITGNTNILGSMFALQTAPNMVSVLNLGGLNIGAGGLLSGFLPANASLLGSNVFASTGLNLNVASNIVNLGTITTPGTLNISSAASISNLSTGTVQAMMAAQNINMITGSGNIINSGLIQATNSMNLNTLGSTTDLIINNTGGVMEALGAFNPVSSIFEDGIINLRGATDVELANTGLWGGSISAPGGINVFGKGMEVHADKILGPLSNTGSIAHVSVSEGELVLGDQILSGDPSYFNNAGNITISSLTTVAGNLAIVASGDIITTGATTIRTTAANNTIFLGAGLNFTLAGGASNVGSFASNAPGDTNASHVLTFTGTTNPGGDINAANNKLTLTTTGTGTITLVGSGSVITGTGNISTGSGDILIIGNGFSTSGNITSTAGDITVASAIPAGLAGITVVNGTLSALPTVGAATAGAITLDTITTRNTVNNVLTLPAQGTSLATPPALPAFAAGTSVISVTSNGAVTLNSDISNNASASGKSGGVIIISGATVSSGVQRDISANGSGAGDGGIISLTATNGSLSMSSAGNGNFRLIADTQSTGAAKNGGFLSVVTGGAGNTLTVNANGLQARALGTNGNGGQIYATSTAGSGGKLTTVNNTTFSLNGRGSGVGGVISLSADTLVLPASANRTWSASAIAGGTGDGGIINLNQTGAGAFALDSNITLAANASTSNNANLAGGTVALSSGGSLSIASAQVQARATTSVGASASGNGGSIILTSSGTLSVTGTGLDVDAGQNGGNGGTIRITNNAAATANTQIAGALSANGSGTGQGGNIFVQYADSTASNFVIGSVPAASGINGSISANGGGSGVGGTVTLSNKLGTNTNISLTTAASSISASGTNLGSLNFNVASAGGAALNAASAVSVTGSAVGNGTLSGLVNASGTSVTLNPQSAASTLNINQVVGTSASGLVSITNNNGASSIVVANNGLTPSILSADDITINTPSIANNGLIRSSQNGGSIVVRNALAASSNLTLAGSGTYQVNSNNATNAIQIRAGSNGTGTLSISGSNTFNVGTATVSPTAIQFNGSQINLATGTTQTISNNANVSFLPGAASALTMNLTGAAGTAAFLGTGNYAISGNGAGNGVSVTAAATPSTLRFAGPVQVNTTGAGALSVANGVTLAATNQNISVTTGSVNLNATGAINAGNAKVLLQPNAAGTTIGLNGGAGAFSVAGTALANITAGTLQVGNNTSGLFTQTGALNVSGAGPAAAYNLDFRSGAGYTGAGSTTSLGTKTLSIASVGAATIGTINGGNTTVNLSGSSVALGANLTLGAGSTANVTSTAGSITQTGGTVTASNLDLDATGGGIGSLTSAVANVLSAKATAGDVVLNNSGVLANFSASASGKIDLTNDATITVGGLVSAGTNVSLIATNGGITQSAGSDISALNKVSLTAGNGSVSIGAAVDATAVGTGLVSITASNSIGDAGLANIAAANINLKSTGADINLTTGGLSATQSISLDGSTGVSSTGGQLNTMALTANGGTGAITISDTNATNLTLTTGTSVNLTDTAVAGKTVIVNASKGGTTAPNVFMITATQAALTTAGQINGYDITLEASNGVLTLGTAVIGTNSVSAKSAGTLLVSNFSNISAPNVTLSTTLAGNDIVIDAGVTATSSITLNSAGSINRLNPGDVLAAPTVNLTAAIDIGSKASPILTSTTSAATGLTINSGGDVFVTENSGNTRLGSSTVGGSLTLNSAASVSTTGNISAANFTLNSAALHNDNFVNGGALLEMVSAGGITIDQALSGTITAGTISTVSSAGSVNIVQDNLNGTLTGSALNSYSADSKSGNLTASGISAGSDLTLNSGGNLVSNNSIAGISSTGGKAALFANGKYTNDGSVTSGTGIQIQSTLDLTNNGSLAANGGTLQATVLGGNMIFTPTSVSTATQDIQLSSSGQININANGADGASLTAFNNLVATANDTITIGSVAGGTVNMSAGRSTSSTLALMPAGSIISNGNLSISSLNGVQINDNTVLTSHGGQSVKNTGDLSITSGGAIALGKNNNLTAFGGDLWFNSDGNISIDKGSQLNSVGKINDGGGTFVTTSGRLLPNYFGGRLGLFAGDSAGSNPTATLDAMVMDRSSVNQFNNPNGVPFNQFSPNYNASGGSIMTIVNTSSGAIPSIDPDLGNVYTLTGGVMLVQQVGTSNISYDPDFTIIGPTLAPPPTPPAPPTNGAFSGNLGIGPIALNLPTATNQGVPTDRILIDVRLAPQSVSTTNTLALGDRRSWYVAEGPEQPFVLEGDDETIIVGLEGTTLAMVQEKTLLVEQGKIVALVGSKSDLVIETNMGVVKVPANGVVIVDTINPKLVRVINLTSVTAQMDIPNGDKTSTISIAVGEELVLSADNFPSAELSPHDGFSRQALSFTGHIVGKRVYKNGIDRQQIVAQERLLGCATGGECLTESRVDALKSEVGALQLSPKSQLKPSNLDTAEGIKQHWEKVKNSLMKPVAFSSTLGATAATSKLLSTFSLSSAIVKHRGAEIEMLGDRIELKRGEILVHADKSTLVRAGESTITIGAGTIALVSRDKFVCKVRNIWEPKQGTVKQIIGKDFIELSAGQESIVGRDEKMIAAEYKHDSIGRRHVRHLELGRVRVSTAEYSIITLLTSSPVLNALVLSKETDDMNMKGKMLKMAACIQTVTSSHGSYTHMVGEH